ncbi:DUF2497 domain-containing protein [Roseicella aquatilis]|uniref:DUF2497 domain-containing protein n=2 Tax=Roseicella aquatilis TaxID=2527868 RepID=A0A4R4D438_9PROT|nr:DUF2497 domain-containing protein [Roseicella aquatilis]
MEDILASIRRILSEDETGSEPAAAAPAPPPPAPVEPAPPAGEEPLDLTEDMLVEPAATVPATPPEPPAAPVPPPEPPTPAAMPPSEPGALLAPAAAAAAAASVSTLLRTVSADRATPVYRGGPSIEDVVRDELRPLLKAWLDEHLPPLVERLVRAEIERVMGGARP